MKIVYSLMWFLIAGILGTSNARDELEASCAKNGGPRAYEALNAGMVDGQNCVFSTINDWAMEVQRSGGKMDAAFELYCDRVGTLKGCAKRFANLIETCLDSEQHKLIDMSYNMTASLLDFGCENSKLFEAAMNSQDKACIRFKPEAIKSCGRKLSASRNITISDRPDNQIDVLKSLSKVKVDFNSKDCREIQNAEECTLQVLAECEDQTFFKILDSLWKHINDNIPCDNLTKSTASSSLVNIFLLFNAVIVMTM